MATFKVKFRPTSENGREGILFYQVIHKRAVRQILTCYKLYKHEWDSETAEFIFSVNEDRNKYLLALKEKVRNDTQLLVNVINTLDNRQDPYTSDHVIAAYQTSKRKDTLFTFMQDIINTLQELGKIRTSETYTSTLNSFMRFRVGEDILLEHIESNLMMAYEAWLQRENVCANSRSFYARILRAVYNRAVEKGITVQKFPFKHVYTGVEKTTKRSISLRDIRKIKEFSFPADSKDDLSRNLFLFSFYTRGMSFIDMAFLKKNDLRNGILSYRRRKTGQLLFIHWEKCMQEIVDKYDTGDSPYLLPIIKNVGDDERLQYLSSCTTINRKLKLLGEKIGLSVPLTMYVARHSWASIARNKNIPLSVISEGLGHDSENTTRIYLSSLDARIIDNANRTILKSIQSKA